MIQAQQIFGAIGLAPLMLFGVTTSIQSSICQPLNAPTISTPVAGNTVAVGALYVAGTSDLDTTVTVSVDGQPAASVTTVSGEYGVSVSVAGGTRTLTAHAANQCDSVASAPVTINVQSPQPPTPPDPGPTPTPTPPPAPNPAPSPSPRPAPRPGGTRQITYLPVTSQPRDTTPTSEPLTLSIDSALDGSKVSYSSVYVSGTLSRAGIVKITKNGIVLAELSSPATTFGFTVPLTDGENKLTITASTSDDVSVNRDIVVTRSGTTANDSPTDYGVLDSDEEGEGSPAKPWYSTLFESIWGYIILGIVGLLILVLLGWLFFVIARRRRKDEEQS